MLSRRRRTLRTVTETLKCPQNPTGQHTIYWVKRKFGKDSNVELSFRDGGKFAAIFNPENGDVTDADVKFGNGRSTVSLPLLSADARFVVLSNRPQIKVTIDTVFVNTQHNYDLHIGLY